MSPARHRVLEMQQSEVEQSVQPWQWRSPEELHVTHAIVTVDIHIRVSHSQHNLVLWPSPIFITYVEKRWKGLGTRLNQ